jgi:hypothetical protein
MKRSKDRHLICIGPDYAFEIDKFCFTLLKRHVSKTGKAHWDTIGYYTSLEAMYYRLVEIGATGLESLQDVCQRQIELKKWVAESLKNLQLIPSAVADWHKSKFLIPE